MNLTGLFTQKVCFLRLVGVCFLSCINTCTMSFVSSFPACIFQLVALYDCGFKCKGSKNRQLIWWAGLTQSLALRETRISILDKFLFAFLPSFFVTSVLYPYGHIIGVWQPQIGPYGGLVTIKVNSESTLHRVSVI